VVQDVFLRVWRRPGSFDARRGELGSYLRMMARSRALDLWREGQAAGRASDRLQLVVDGAPPPAEDSPAVAAELGATRETVIEALQQLPEPQREALVLAYWGGLTAGEIADHEHVPLGTAKSRIRLGLARLRQECPALAQEAA
jgi:RNA polymerase sigma-70 factor (ECF subfamily)